MSSLAEIDDPRRPSNGTLHDFREILVIMIAAVLPDCDTVEDIAFWGRKKKAWLRRFLMLKNGVPSEETFLRILRALDSKQFEAVFRRWVGGVVGALSADTASNGTISGTIAIDAKTVRGSGSGGERAIHMVSAFATGSNSCSARKRWRPRATNSPRFPSCSKRCRSRDYWSPSTPWGHRIRRRCIWASCRSPTRSPTSPPRPWQDTPAVPRAPTSLRTRTHRRCSSTRRASRSRPSHSPIPRPRGLPPASSR